MLLTLEQRQASHPTCLRTRQVFTRIQLHADRRTMPILRTIESVFTSF